MCPCNADIMTAEHLLQHCPLHDAMRRDTWPDPTLLRDKLYGNLEELRRTAAFVRATGISILRTTKKKKNLPHLRQTPYHLATDVVERTEQGRTLRVAEEEQLQSVGVVDWHSSPCYLAVHVLWTGVTHHHTVPMGIATAGCGGGGCHSGCGDDGGMFDLDVSMFALQDAKLGKSMMTFWCACSVVIPVGGDDYDGIYLCMHVCIQVNMC